MRSRHRCFDRPTSRVRPETGPSGVEGSHVFMTSALNLFALIITKYLERLYPTAVSSGTHQNKWGNRQRSIFHIANGFGRD